MVKSCGVEWAGGYVVSEQAAMWWGGWPLGFYCHPKSLDWDLDFWTFGLGLDNILDISFNQHESWEHRFLDEGINKIRDGWSRWRKFPNDLDLGWLNPCLCQDLGWWTEDRGWVTLVWPIYTRMVLIYARYCAKKDKFWIYIHQAQTIYWAERNNQLLT